MHSTDDRDTGRNLSLAVIVPALNEAETIQKTIAGLRSISSKLRLTGVNLSIYVVDDGSTDHTGKLAKEAGADRVLRQKVNAGLGAAVRLGLRVARDHNFDIVVKFDADLQHDPNDILSLIVPILDDEADIVYGNRFERISYKMPWVRLIGNRLFSRLMRGLTGWPIKDSQPGIFAANSDYLRVFTIVGDYNYTQQVIIDAYNNGMRFAQVPVAFNPRTKGHSFISFRYPFKVFPQILLTIAATRPLKIFVPIGSFFLIVASSIAVFQLVLWLAGHSEKPIENVNLVIGSGLFGLQTIFFGILAQLILQSRKQ